MGDHRPVGGAAEIGHRQGAECARAGGKKAPAGKPKGNAKGRLKGGPGRNPARNFDGHAGPFGAVVGMREVVRKHLGSKCDGSIAERPAAMTAYKVPVARNCALARCRFCGMFASNALRSATAWWNCWSAILNAVNAPSSMAPSSKQCSVSRNMLSASACIVSALRRNCCGARSRSCPAAVRESTSCCGARPFSDIPRTRRRRSPSRTAPSVPTR